ncbi:MAG TPA: hypothetical protein QF753_18840 [Victivallales bacterium]|nr:hypothetical protein [Victivallales bacterium]
MKNYKEALTSYIFDATKELKSLQLINWPVNRTQLNEQINFYKNFINTELKELKNI